MIPDECLDDVMEDVQLVESSVDHALEEALRSDSSERLGSENQLDTNAIKNLIQDESDDYEEPEVSQDELELA